MLVAGQFKGSDLKNATRDHARDLLRKHVLGLSFSILLLCLSLAASLSASAAPAAVRTRHHHAVGSTYAARQLADPAKDDDTANDDPIVRQAAVKALGRYDGSVVAIDPSNGRILAIVNQKLAFSTGYKPCSTIKPVIAVAALQERLITRDTMIRVAQRKYLNLAEALAHSNNRYFEELGRRMGFDTVSNYARTLGLGERAGYEISEEQAGAVPNEPPKRGGVARMSSFGEGIQMTLLQLGVLASAVANGGTLYYLQYPRTAEEKENFEPRIKRDLNIEPLLPDVREGMLAAVLHGTARRSFVPDGEEESGKTGTCSDAGTRLGWYASFAGQENRKIVLVVLLRGHSKAVKGPLAAGVAGSIYRQLHQKDYFAAQAANTDASISASMGSDSSLDLTPR